VLAEDPDLAGSLAGRRRAEAVRGCVAPVARIDAGPWPLETRAPHRSYAIGLLILDGLAMRRVGLEGHYGAELLGPGDLLRPWQDDDLATARPRAGEWELLSRCRIAVLDAGFALRLSRYPEVTAALFDRVVRRSRRLAVNMAIVHQPRVEVRLQMLFWLLADRWGIRGPEGVRLPVPLTHAILGELVAARRQTVSKALGELAERDLLSRHGEVWLLRGEPPFELGEVAALTAADPGPPAVDASG
jgi:CRP-like cAMP-binding protein